MVLGESHPGLFTARCWVRGRYGTYGRRSIAIMVAKGTADDRRLGPKPVVLRYLSCLVPAHHPSGTRSGTDVILRFRLRTCVLACCVPLEQCFFCSTFQPCVLSCSADPRGHRKCKHGLSPEKGPTGNSPSGDARPLRSWSGQGPPWMGDMAGTPYGREKRYYPTQSLRRPRPVLRMIQCLPRQHRLRCMAQEADCE